jgi:hypothetical protein
MLMYVRLLRNSWKSGNLCDVERYSNGATTLQTLDYEKVFDRREVQAH